MATEKIYKNIYIVIFYQYINILYIQHRQKFNYGC